MTTAGNETIFLREADRFDVPSLARLRIRSLCEMSLLEPSAIEEFSERATRELHEHIKSGRLIAWLLIDDAAIVGAACVLLWQRLPYPGSSLHAELAGVYIDEAYRRRGFARELSSEAIACARGRGVRKIFVHPSAAAHSLYEQLGFAPGGQMELRLR